MNWLKLVVSYWLIAGGSLLFGSGFGLYETGVQSQGNAGAFVARAEDGSAMVYNPAGLAQLTFNELSLSVKPSFSKSFYSNPGQTTWPSKVRTDVLPNFFWNHSLGRMAVGLGSATTFNDSLDWDRPDFPGRFTANFSEFRVQEYLAAMAFKLSPAFSVGATLRWAQADYRIDNVLPRPITASDPSQFFETTQSYDMSGDDVGFTLGLQYRPSRRFSVGLGYQSAIEIDLSGSHSFAQLTGLDDQRAISQFNSLFPGNAPVTSRFELPARVQLGVARKITVRTRLEVDASLEEWSSVDRQVLTTQNTTGNSQTVIDRQWDDVVTIRVGGDFQQRKALLWSMGIASVESVVPDQTVDPSFPDFDRFIYSFGVAYTYRQKYVFEAAWLFVQNRDRSVTDQEFIYDPNAPDFVTSTGQGGLFETQRTQFNLGVRMRLGVPAKKGR